MSDIEPIGDLNSAAQLVVRAAAALSGDVPLALSWFRSEPLATFGGATAQALVEQGRAEDVMNYLESLAAGAAG